MKSKPFSKKELDWMVTMLSEFYWYQQVRDVLHLILSKYPLEASEIEGIDNKKPLKTK